MSRRWFFSCFITATLLGASPIAADTIFLADGKVIFGRVLETEPESILFNQRLENGQGYRQRKMDRSAIKTMVVNIHPDQLAKVDPREPDSYYAIAEILDPQRLDPEARDLAIRLYLLAAKYGSPAIRDTSLLKLIRLARTPGEQNKFNALANRYVDVSAFQIPPQTSVAPKLQPLSDETKQRLRNLRKAIEALRTDHRTEAADIIGRKWMEQTMAPFRNICSWRELRSWSLAPDMKIEWLARMLELELAIEAILDLGSDEIDQVTDWARLANRKVQPLVPIDIDNVTEFDLTKNKFLDGVWVSNPEK